MSPRDAPQVTTVCSELVLHQGLNTHGWLAHVKLTIPQPITLLEHCISFLLQAASGLVTLQYVSTTPVS